ncbi:MAG: response regulator, partial [Cohnella sp.]|nr:response regulator [Cohnella sp.]
MHTYLIVDDEPLIRKGMIKLISRVAPNWESCGEAWNGAEGLEMAERLRPDLIFSDIRMPEMNGLEMAALLIERGFAVPIVFFTGHDEFAYIQQALKNNAFDYLLKPIKENDVRQLFDRYEREYIVSQAVEKKDMTQIKQYEFYLQNALECENLKQLEELEPWYDRLQASLPLRSFVELTIRTVHSFLLRRDVIGAEYRPVINATNASNVIRMLQAHCVAQVEETRESNANRIIEKVQIWVNDHIQNNP